MQLHVGSPCEEKGTGGREEGREPTSSMCERLKVGKGGTTKMVGSLRSSQSGEISRSREARTVMFGTEARREKHSRAETPQLRL